MKVRNLELAVLKPYEKNPRINAQSVDQVKRSIEEFGFQQPIVVDKDYVIIVGHTRYQAAKALQLKFVPVIVADELTEAKAKAYRLMDNRTHETSTWDVPLLLQEMDDLKEFYSAEFLDLQKYVFETSFPEENFDQEPEEKPKKLFLTVSFDNEDDQQDLFLELKDRGFKVK